MTWRSWVATIATSVLVVAVILLATYMAATGRRLGDLHGWRCTSPQVGEVCERTAPTPSGVRH
jgi:hypothetical protein